MAFAKANVAETLAGKIVLSISCDRDTETAIFASMNDIEQQATGQMLAQLHFHKIDLADEILIINVDGYVGPSTNREIEYAAAQNKSIRWLEPMQTP
jgi:hypothetical protein